MAQLCSCCDLPATHHFAVSYRGQVLTGAICEEHGNVVARHRLGMQDGRGTLGATKISRALTDPISKPYFQRIREWDQQEIGGDASGLNSERSSETGFSARRRRSMIRWRHSRPRGGGGQVDGADLEPVVIPATVYPEPLAHPPDSMHVPDSVLIIDGDKGDPEGLNHARERDPIRVRIVDAIEVLDRYAVPLEAGERKAGLLLKQHGESIGRSALRAAIKERREIASAVDAEAHEGWRRSGVEILASL